MERPEDWVDEFVERVLDTFAGMDFRTLQPLINVELEVLYAREFLENLRRAANNPSTLPALSKMRGEVSPGTLSDQMLFTAINLKMAGWPVEERMGLMQFFHDALKVLHAGDIFVSSGRNCVLNQAELDSSLERLELAPATPAIARLLGKLYAAVYHLSNGFYSDMYMGICIQNYGGYDVSNKFGPGRELVIKNAFHLHPTDIWPESASLPFNVIKIYCVYKDAGFSTDLFSCHSQYSGDPIGGLEYWAVEADGRPLDSREIEGLVRAYSRASVEYWKKITSLPLEELKKKCVLIRQFAVKPLFDAAGLDWRPSQEMMDAVAGKPLRLPESLLVPTADRQHWRRILDPRIEFEVK